MQTVMELVKLHQEYAIDSLNLPHLRGEDIIPVINTLLKRRIVHCEAIHYSYEQRPIYHLSIGNGPENILAWTQMHGDEPTATASVLDLLNVLTLNPDILPQSFWQNFTLHVIPMLNPDGAESKQRVNAQGLDINRDSLHLQTPEGRLLEEIAITTKPCVAFNLHDQNDYYGAGHGGEPTTVSFLAPSAEPTKFISETRKRAMQLIVSMYEMINLELPKQIGRYDDTFSERSFGDQLMANGIATILIEAGKQFHDPYRQSARQMITISLLTALKTLADKSYRNLSVDRYFDIPLNHEDSWVDIKFCNIQVLNTTYPYQIDITVNIKDGKAFIQDVGDGRNVHAFKTFHCQDWCIDFELAKRLTKDMPADFELCQNDHRLFVQNGQMLNPPEAFRSA